MYVPSYECQRFKGQQIDKSATENTEVLQLQGTHLKLDLLLLASARRDIGIKKELMQGLSCVF